jgi:hypothetical protein
MNCCYDCFAEVLFSYADESWSEHEARVMLRFGLGEKNGRLCFPLESRSPGAQSGAVAAWTPIELRSDQQDACCRRRRPRTPCLPALAHARVDFNVRPCANQTPPAAGGEQAGPEISGAQCVSGLSIFTLCIYIIL